MSHRPAGISRRAVGKLLIALPAATLPFQEKKEEDKPTELAEFIAAREAGLSPEERERLAKNVTQLEKSLATVRDFKLPLDVDPCLRFQAVKSRSK